MRPAAGPILRRVGLVIEMAVRAGARLRGHRGAVGRRHRRPPLLIVGVALGFRPLGYRSDPGPARRPALSRRRCSACFDQPGSPSGKSASASRSRGPGRGEPGALGIFLLEAVPGLVGAVVALELAPELRDVREGAGVLLLVLGVEQVGVQVGEQRVLGLAGGAEAVAEGVVGGRLGLVVLGGGGLDDGTDVGLGLGELLGGDQALGLGQPRLALAERAFGRRPGSGWSYSAIALSWSPFLSKSLARRTAARSALWGSFAMSAIVFSTAAKSPFWSWSRVRLSSAATTWRPFGYALTTASSSVTASAARLGSPSASSARS